MKMEATTLESQQEKETEHEQESRMVLLGYSWESYFDSYGPEFLT